MECASKEYFCVIAQIHAFQYAVIQFLYCLGQKYMYHDIKENGINSNKTRYYFPYVTLQHNLQLLDTFYDIFSNCEKAIELYFTSIMS